MIALKVWATTVLTAFAAVLAAFGWVRWKGRQRERTDTAARISESEQRVRVAERERADSEIRTEVDTDVLQLPTGTTTPVAVAVPDSAADRLYDDWSRDGNNDGLRVDTPDSGVSTGSTHGSDSTTNLGP
jgi:cytoskeletal protein RodZ